METKSLYDTDLNVWLQMQKRLLLERRFDELDVENLAAEIDEIAARERSRIRRLIRKNIRRAYVIRFKPGRLRRAEGLFNTARATMELEDLFDQNPSLDDAQWLLDLVEKERVCALPIVKEKLSKYGVDPGEVEIWEIGLYMILPPRTASRVRELQIQKRE